MTRLSISTLHNLLCLLALAVTVRTHPQCLDFRPPFEAQTPLQFCANYSDFGCCTPSDDRDLHHTFLRIRHLVSGQDWNRCNNYLQEILCQSCSPYAAHIFDAERTMQARSFPGLCSNYCSDFFRHCKDVISFLDPSFTGSRLLQHEGVFCQHVGLTDVDYCYPDLLTSSSLNGVLQQQKETREGCLCLEPVAQNLTSALFARHAGDGSGRLFVAEQPGVVKILYPRSKNMLTSPFLDISARVKVSRGAGDERGFLGLAFHPQFSRNGRFFVYYTARIPDRDDVTRQDQELGINSYDHVVRVSEMRVSRHNPNMADPGFERLLLEIPQPYSNHNGGELLFLDDGLLYVFVGDGGAGGDPHNLAQNKSSLLGKVLRLDVDSKTGRAYSIPRHNPFLHQTGARPEIFALGVRNIWRCGVDAGHRDTGSGRGRVLCGDVGQNAFEEVDKLRAGANYGWNIKEGFSCYLDEDTCRAPIENEELPVHSYPHSDGKSVTGGHFYRGCENPALDGLYIYGDYWSGRLFSLEETPGGGWRNKDVTLCGDDVCFNGLTNDYDVYILSFGQDENGEMYMLTSPTSRPKRSDTRIFKLIDPLRRGNPASCPGFEERRRIMDIQLPTSTNPTSGSSAARVPSIQDILVRVCGVTPSFLCPSFRQARRQDGQG